VVEQQNADLQHDDPTERHQREFCVLRLEA
jgi:hypothetical protein